LKAFFSLPSTASAGWPRISNRELKVLVR